MLGPAVYDLGAGATVKRAERSAEALIDELLTYLLTYFSLHNNHIPQITDNHRNSYKH